MAQYFKQFKFANDEVIVNIPVKIMPGLEAVSKKIGIVPMTVTSNFKPIRVVANIAFQEVGKPGKYLINLGGVVKIKVKYRASDKKLAGNEELKLGYWDGLNWVILPAIIVAYATPSKGGYGIILTKIWSDPPMAWGT